MSDHIPTTEEVREFYMPRYVSAKEAEFNRWLAEHDAEVAEETLNTVIMLLNSELEETEPHPEEARGLARALQIVFLLATRQGPRYET